MGCKLTLAPHPDPLPRGEREKSRKLPSIMHSMLVELGGRLRSTDELLDEESSSASSRRMVAVGAT